MKSTKLFSLKHLACDAIAYKIFHRLMTEDDEKTQKLILCKFYCSLPRPIAINIMRVLLLLVDKGHECLTGAKSSCRIHSWSYNDSYHVPTCRYHHQVAKLSFKKRHKAFNIVRQIVSLVMVLWHEEEFHPTCLEVRNYPVLMGLITRQWVVAEAIEVFFQMHNVNCPDIVVSEEEFDGMTNMQKTQWVLETMGVEVVTDRAPIAVLNLQSLSDYSSSCMRSILSKMQSFLDYDLNDLIMEGEQDEDNLFLDEYPDPLPSNAPTIAMSTAMVYGANDWFTSVLLHTMKKCCREGVAITFNKVVFENPTTPTCSQVLKYLSHPQDVQVFEYRAANPRKITSVVEEMKHLTGVEVFRWGVLSDFNPTYIESDYIKTLWDTMALNWPMLREARFIGTQMCFHHAEDEDGCTDQSLISFPLSLKTIVLYGQSATPSFLNKIAWELENGYLDGATMEIAFIRENTIIMNCWGAFLKFFKAIVTHFGSVKIKHCGLRFYQIQELAECIENEWPLITQTSPLRCFTMHEGDSSWEASCRMMTALLPAKATTTNEKFKKLEYASFLVPGVADETARVLRRQADATNQRDICPFQNSMDQLVKRRGRPDVKVEMVWDPTLDWHRFESS